MKIPPGFNRRLISINQSLYDSSDKCENTEKEQMRSKVPLGSCGGGTEPMWTNVHHLFDSLQNRIMLSFTSTPQSTAGSTSRRKHRITRPHPQPKSRIASYCSKLPPKYRKGRLLT